MSIPEATNLGTPRGEPVPGDLPQRRDAGTADTEDENIPSKWRRGPLQRRIRSAPRLVKQCEDYIRLMEDRVSSLEARFANSPVHGNDDSGESQTSYAEDDATSSVGTTSMGVSIERPKMQTSIPQLNLVPWDEWKHLDRIPAQHYAIDILSHEPSGEIQAPVSGSKGTALLGDSNLVHRKSPSRRPMLPEQIRINSRRIQCVLDYDLWDGSLHYPTDQSFYLLRPFKLLVYLEAKIRKRLRDFEQVRKNLEPKTEDEYASKYKQNPAPDTGVEERQDESKMTLSELTGFVNDLRCLVQFIDEYIKPVQIELQTRPSTIRFSELWYLFQPGSLVFVKDKKIPQKVWKVIQRTGGRRYICRPDRIMKGSFGNKFSSFVLDCYHLDHDGTRVVATFHKFTINKFDDMQQVTFLPVYPLEAAINENVISRETLIKHGQQFIQSTKVCRRHYSGRSLSRAPNGVKLATLVPGKPANICVFSERVESEVMVDFEQALQEVPDWRPGLDELKTHEIDPCEYGESWTSDDWFDRDMTWDTLQTDDFMDAEAERWHRWDISGLQLSEDDLLLLPDRVFAFVFRNRKWG